MRIVIVGGILIVITTIATALRQSTVERRHDKASRRSVAIVAGLVGLIGWCGGGALYISHADAVYKNCISGVNGRNGVRAAILSVVDDLSNHNTAADTRTQAILDRPEKQGGIPAKTSKNCEDLR